MPKDLQTYFRFEKLSCIEQECIFKVTGYLSVIKYSTNKQRILGIVYLQLRSGMLLKHSVDYLDNENHNYERHLVQGIQLQTWTAKQSKISPSNSCWLQQLESTQTGGHSLVAVVSFFCNIAFAKGY